MEEAINGEEAVLKARTGAYDAVLMDIQMPVMDGLEATRQIRALAATPGSERFATLPIIAMTALAMAGDAEKTRAAGMNDHVTKPVNPELLMAALARWVRRPGAGTVPVADAGGDSRDQMDSPSPATGSAVPAGSAPMTTPPDIATLPSPALSREDAAPLDNLPSLDTRAGIRRIGGKVAAYRRQLQRFRAHYPDAVDELERRLAAEGLEAAEAYCHALKGVAGNLGAQNLFQQVNAIDETLKQGQPPTAAALAALRARLGEVMADIDRLAAGEAADTAGGATHDPGGPAPLDPSQVQELLTALDQALEMDLGAAEPLLERLKNGARGTPLETAIAALAAQVDVFDIDAARQSLAALSLRTDSAPKESPP